MGEGLQGETEGPPTGKRSPGLGISVGGIGGAKSGLGFSVSGIGGAKSGFGGGRRRGKGREMTGWGRTRKRGGIWGWKVWRSGGNFVILRWFT